MKGEHALGVSFWQRNKKVLMPLVALMSVGTLFTLQSACCGRSDEVPPLQQQQQELCPPTAALRPSFNGSVAEILHDAHYKEQSIERLSRAVRIPTEVQDVNPAPEDDPDFYAQFYKFHEFLQTQFPLVHKQLRREVVNRVGLLYTWEGTETDLKPVVLMSHQDVVPVNRETWDDWEYPPFSGHYDEETDLLWGRGSNDCKNLLIAEFEAIEKLLEDGFTPRRTLLLSLGFDEESSGKWGAGFLGPYIHDRYGDDSALIIIDEGEGIVKVDENLYVATPINGEKGYVDVTVDVVGHGGHSSIPPDHTTIGVASQLIALMEDNPWDYDFQLDNPLYGMLSCSAEHSSTLAPHVRDAIVNASWDERKRRELTDYVASQKTLRDLIRTTQAIDIIHGGIKANALPESTTFLVNHRVDLHSSVAETVERDLDLVKIIADKYGYGVKFMDNFLVDETELGYIELSFSKGLEPAPKSPNSGEVWDTLAGTIQDVFENAFNKDTGAKKELYVTTGLFSGNTDTKHYWNITKNIYRFTGSIAEGSVLKGVHSVNEYIPMSAHLPAIAFLYEFIINVNEYL
ncbi:Gly-Xaa carboxypeptidase KNAG_0C02380 [Huiozyma naganishii CBS 8797]|uniref:Peptidase M20 dimerisation domain-containing protein n=1 Tax=Huiozyma naganishii (strain ATCC MYA-139 / BCRC 22969 / CBS 8797 / KCTC 17520 / NBRC 10181 / NCYC 3082 / Yp74L-3) TaxID=1071383 RepID=J7S4L0_HUIN7|nr:hypothetical protein KNAG_0C02380 [Kazachstania naganishii CBS 8797]CCK69349.1 hypothetical protein KNAG_0C02380 [Kazachstania naganishii CBS 8797]